MSSKQQRREARKKAVREDKRKKKEEKREEKERVPLPVFEIEHEMRERFLKLYEKIVIPELLEEHWKRVWEAHDQAEQESSDEVNEKQGWNLENVWFDSFHIRAGPGRRDQGEDPGTNYVRMVCNIPAPPAYWDLIFSYYLVKRPDVFVNPQTMCRHVLKVVKEVGVNPHTDYVNFHPDHIRWLEVYATGKERHFKMLESTHSAFQVCYSLKVLPLLAAAGANTEEKIERYDQQAELKRALATDPEEIKKRTTLTEQLRVGYKDMADRVLGILDPELAPLLVKGMEAVEEVIALTNRRKAQEQAEEFQKKFERLSTQEKNPL